MRDRIRSWLLTFLLSSDMTLTYINEWIEINYEINAYKVQSLNIYFILMENSWDILASKRYPTNGIWVYYNCQYCCAMLFDFDTDKLLWYPRVSTERNFYDVFTLSEVPIFWNEKWFYPLSDVGFGDDSINRFSSKSA